jgi:ATP-dependent Clp protease ATP-binding subunit ClpA
MNEFGSYIHAIIERGREEARQDRSPAVEAQHLLLAMAAGADNPATQILLSAGLDHQALRDAFDREFESSLAAAGVSVAGFGLPAPSMADRPDKLGASTRQALMRAMAAARRKKNLTPAHLLVGILGAQAGTVPRALALAGVRRADLADRARQALDDDGR